MARVLVLAFVAIANVVAEEPCCKGACKEDGMEKYWSIAKSLFGTKHCGECCMKPSDYKLYHFFEKNLTKSDRDFPCAFFGYTKYDSTATHGFGPVKMTLDLYDLPDEPAVVEEPVAEVAKAEEPVVEAPAKPCCQGACQEPGMEKYWSIAKGFWGKPHCGECCMKPKDYKLYHFFEANLTKSAVDEPCKSFGYTTYDSTDTHGFGPIKMTLDLYNLPEKEQAVVETPPAVVKESVAEVAPEKPCCQGQCQEPGMKKYWSIAKGFWGTPHCGECCMKPKDYKLYHFFEANLTESKVDFPCKSFGYTTYDSTDTHGFGPVKMTLDLYNLPKKEQAVVETLPAVVKESVAEMAPKKPCCVGQCQEPGMKKYWSIAKGFWGTAHCGECCMKPKDYKLYHFFEANLTESKVDFPCKSFGYAKYDSTDTHGFGPISMTLDLYDKPAAAEIMI